MTMLAQGDHAMTRRHDEPLASLPADREGFRLRGLEMTRIETFTDAAFAFAVTFLVVSTASANTFRALSTALAGIPAFAVSFVLIMVFWVGHWKWSRRYGQEDMPVIMLSGALVFVLLIYIYPLKFLYSLSVDYFFGRQITGATIERAAQLNYSFAIYGAGFALMNLIVAGLYGYSYRQREALQLDELERFLTRSEAIAWLLVAGVGLLSTAVALLTEPSPAAPAGWVYMILPVIMPIFGRRASRTAQRLRLTHREPSP
jgi:uncharacterized membrane protein